MKDKDDELEDLIKAIMQMTDAKKKVIQSINYNKIFSISEEVKELTKTTQIPKFDITTLGFQNTLQMYPKLEENISNVLKTSYIATDILSGISPDFLNSIAKIQASTSLFASIAEESKMISEVNLNLASLNIAGCIEAIQQVLNTSFIEMPDFSFLKKSQLVNEIKSELSFPSGIRTDLNSFNLESASHLMSNKDIVFDTKERKFICPNNEESSANTREINVICSAVKIFNDENQDEVFTDRELIDFMSLLADTPMMAFKSEVGKRIYSIINQTKYLIGFDKSEYYHARAREKGIAPYVWNQMKKAPYGVTYPGRYNHVGQAHFYFADTYDGVVREVSKHMSDSDKENKEIQTVKIHPINEVKMIDLSEKSKRGYNIFLKYIRFSLQQNAGNMPREYLIPSFVSDCCKDSKIGGIKYYGGKSYSNYVTWEDSYFECIGNVDENGSSSTYVGGRNDE